MQVRRVSFLMAFFLCLTFIFSGCGDNAQEKLDDMIQTSYTEIDDVLSPIYDSIVADVLGKVYDQGTNYVAYHMWDLGEIQNDGIKEIKLAMFYKKDGNKYYTVYDIKLSKIIKIKKLLSTSIQSEDYVFEPIYFYNFQQSNYGGIKIEDKETFYFLNLGLNDKNSIEFGNLPEQLNGGKLEFGETLTLPVPQLPVGNYDYSVGVYGPVGSQINKETFTPSKEGTYTIVYSLYHKDAPQTILDTKEFVVEVGDTVGPVVHVDWNLEPSYKVNSHVLIPVFTSSDNSKINLEDSTIVISSNSFRRTIYGNEIAEEYAKGEEGRLYIPLNYNEIYTVTYTVYDNSTSRNSTIITEQIRVGDLVEPTIILPDNYVPTKVRLDETLTFDTKGIKVKDTNGEGETIEFTEDEVKNKVKVSIKGPNGELDNLNVDSDDKVINDGIFIFDIDTAGTYTVTISVEDEAGNTGEVKRTFTVNDTKVTPLTDNEIITIVLICVAVLVLAGAVVYAVVSSKKTKAYKQ